MTRGATQVQGLEPHSLLETRPAHLPSYGGVIARGYCLEQVECLKKWEIKSKAPLPGNEPSYDDLVAKSVIIPKSPRAEVSVLPH